MLQPAKAICELLASTPQGGVDAGAAMDQVEGTAELVVKSVSVVSCHWQPAALLRPFRPKLYDDCIAARPTRTQAFVATLSWIGRAFGSTRAACSCSLIGHLRKADSGPLDHLRFCRTTQTTRPTTATSRIGPQ